MKKEITMDIIQKIKKDVIANHVKGALSEKDREELDTFLLDVVKTIQNIRTEEVVFTNVEIPACIAASSIYIQDPLRSISHEVCQEYGLHGAEEFYLIIDQETDGTL